MSEKTKQNIDDFFIWLTRGVIMVNIWFLSQVYYDFQNLKGDVQQIKIKIGAMESSLDFIKNFDVKPKR